MNREKKSKWFKNRITFVMIFITLGGFFIAGCDIGDEGDDYYPLTIGSYWVYEATQGETTMDMTITITGKDTLSNGSEVVVMEISASGVSMEAYYEIRDKEMWFYEDLDLEYDSGSLFLKFPLRVGKSWETTQNEITGTGEVVAVEDVSTAAGDFNDCFYVEFRDENGEDGTDWWLAKGIGMVKKEVDDLDAIYILKEYSIE